MKTKEPVLSTLSTEKLWLKEWLFDHAPVRSGKLKERMLPWGTFKEIWDHYSHDAMAEGHVPYSIFVLQQCMKMWKIRRAKFDKYRCQTCFDGISAIRHQDHNDTQENNSQTIEKYFAHQNLIHDRSQHYQQSLNLSHSNDPVILWDYSTIHDTSTFKLKVLNFSIWYNQSWSYVDYFGTASHTWHFSRQAWKLLLFQHCSWLQSATTLWIWGDGGLKTKNNLYTFKKLQETLECAVKVRYFAPHHGHSVCDGHFGAGKQQLRKVLGTKLINKPEEIIQVFQYLKNTTTYYLNTINVNEKEDICGLKFGVRKFFDFEFERENNDNIKCRENTTSEWVFQQINVKN